MCGSRGGVHIMSSILVNRAPVLTLWAAVVAERLGHPADTALTLGRAVAGSAARVKARKALLQQRPTLYPGRTFTGWIRSAYPGAPPVLMGSSLCALTSVGPRESPAGR